MPDESSFTCAQGGSGEGGEGTQGSCRALRGAEASHHSRCRYRILQKPILGTADSECWHCLGVRGFLFEIPQAGHEQGAKRALTLSYLRLHLVLPRDLDSSDQKSV